MAEEVVGSPDKGGVTTVETTPASASAPVSVPDAQPGTAMASLAKVAAAQPASSAGKPVKPEPGASPVLSKEAGASVQPGEPGGDLWTDIPQNRRDAITKNIREQAAREATEAVTAKLGWAEQYEPAQVEAAFGIIARMQQDPVAFFRQLGAELAEAGVNVGGEQAADDPRPLPDMVSEDGKHKVYSDAQLDKLLEWKERQMESKFLDHVNPMREFMETAQNRERVTNIITESRAEAAQVLSEMRSKPHFKENEKEIAAALNAIPKEVKAKVGSHAALYMAYTTVLENKVFPTIGREAEQQVRTQLREKAAVGIGTVVPGGQPAAPKPKISNVDQLAARMREMAAV